MNSNVNGVDEVPKKSIVIFTYKQGLLSLDMKTKVVQHVPKTLKTWTRDILNNFCFHVYAQKSLFIAENCNAFFYISILTLSCEFRVHRAGSQLKIVEQLPLPKKFLSLGPKISILRHAHDRCHAFAALLSKQK